jgi:cytochrome c-type biogenesis protein CcmE
VDRANDTFVLEDADANLTVHLDRELPTQVQQGKTVLAEGTLVGDEPLLEASSIEIGCPSQY